MKKNMKKATFAGGCFWCIQAAFKFVDGVKDAVSGYTGGKTENPTYEDVAKGTTGHFEAVEVTYDPKKISYEKLLKIYWTNIDPTDKLGQFSDKGTEYRTAIFYHDDKQRALAERSKKELEESGKFDMPIVVQILPASMFYPAEEEHQDYFKKRSLHYKLYKKGSGREGYIKKTWGEG